MQQEDNPFYALRPPASDATTYLTFLEHNLNEDALPMLHDILQDATITSEIGWDLISLLLPLLPASEQCLMDIAKLGNPREAVLKVAEAIRELRLDNTPDSDGESQHEDEPSLERLDISGSSTEDTPAPFAHPSRDRLALTIRQFKVLTHMLSILHPRIKTKYPSRFLSSSLQAVLTTFAAATTHHTELAQELIALTKHLTGTKRPQLPPRRSTNEVFTKQRVRGKSLIGEEAPLQEEDDKQMEKRLLQSFLTHILETYILSLHTAEQDIPGMAWTSRLQEKLHPDKTVPGKTSFTRMFAETDALHDRSETVGQMLALSRDLDIASDELLRIIADTTPEAMRIGEDETEPPLQAADIPYSKTGSLLLLTARKVARALYGGRVEPTMTIFPTHANLLAAFLSSGPEGQIATDSDPLIDTVLTLSLLALENPDGVGSLPTDEEFTLYLQRTSLLSSLCPSPTIRYHAHLLTSYVLHAHPNDLVRYSFIEDTLTHCPLPNLKVSAVEWFKEETLSANSLAEPGKGSATTMTSTQGDASATDLPTPDARVSLFATPIALSKLSDSIFPDLSDSPLVTSHPTSDPDTELTESLPFYLTALNLLYLLLSAKHLHEPLAIPGWFNVHQIADTYLQPLEVIAGRGDALAKLEGLEGQEVGGSDAIGRATVGSELQLLKDAVDRCRSAASTIAKAST